VTNTDLERAVEEFAAKPMANAKGMRQLLSESNREAFLQAAIPLLRSDLNQPGKQYLLTLLLMNDLILVPLADPAIFSFDEAVRIAGQLVKIQPMLDHKMRSLFDTTQNQAAQNAGTGDFGVRLLEIMASLPSDARISSVLFQLLDHSNLKIRSKAALLAGRRKQNSKWVEQRLSDSDLRVRANAVESLWGVDSPGAREVLFAAVTNSNNRVVGNALFGLYRLGEAASIPLIVDLLSHAQTNFRLSGVWVMGETGDPRFLPLLTSMLSDPDPQIRSAVFRSIAKLKQAKDKYSPSPNLRVYVAPSAPEPGERSAIAVALWVRGIGGVQPVSDVRPNQFVLFEDAQPVTSYEVHENSRNEALSIAFVLPRPRDSDLPSYVPWQQAFETALGHKRKCDSWLSVKYVSDGAATPTASRDALPPDSRFHTDPEDILATLEVPGNWRPVSPLKAMSTVLPQLRQCVGTRRQLVLLYHPELPETDWEPWRELAGLALSCRVNVHVIALERQPELVQLAAKTSGTFTRLATPGGFEAALEGLCAILAAGYSIRYRSTTEDALATLRVRVYQPGSYGEVTLNARDYVLADTEVA
jgi:hypothetical protein